MSELNFRPDFFRPNNFANEEDYQQRFLCHLVDKSDRTLCWTESGAVGTVGTVQKWVQWVKGWIGLTDYTDKAMVSLHVIRGLYEGEMHGWISEDTVKSIVENMKPKVRPLQLEKKVQDMVESLFEKKNGKASFKDLQNHAVTFCKRHTDALYESFWNRQWKALRNCFKSEDGSQPDLQGTRFGDTPLALAKLSMKKRNMTQAFDYFKVALDVNNNDADFQKELASEFIKYVEELQNKKTQKNRSFLITLAETAIANKDYNNAEKCYIRALNLFDEDDLKCRLGELYLLKNQKNNAITYFPELIKKYTDSKDAKKLEMLGHAYWENQYYTEAVNVFEKVIKFYPNKDGQDNSTIANLWKKIGDAYFSGHIGGSWSLTLSTVPNYKRAVEYYEKGMESAALTSDSAFKKECVDTYMKAVQKLTDSAQSNYFPKAYQVDASSVLEYFSVCLKLKNSTKAFQVFESLLKLAESTKNPKLIDHVNQLWSQLLVLKETKDLAKNALPTLMKLNEGVVSQLALFNNEMGNAYFEGHIDPHSGGWLSTATPNYQEAYNHFKNAIKHDKSFQKDAFDMFLKLGAEEMDKEKRDVKKAMQYYRWAFELDPTKFGKHIIEMLNESEDDSFKVYLYKHSKSQWPKEYEAMKLEAGTWHKLGSAFIEARELILAISCLMKAMELDPKNTVYLGAYYKAYYHVVVKMRGENKTYEKMKKSVAKIEEAVENKLIDKSLVKDICALLKDIYVDCASSLVKKAPMPRNRSVMIEDRKYSYKDYLQEHKDTLQAAQGWYEKALKVAPDEAFIYFELGQVNEMKDDFYECVDLFRTACEKDPTNPFYWSQYAQSLKWDNLKGDKKIEEGEAIEKALEDGPPMFSFGSFLPSSKAPDDFAKIYGHWKEYRFETPEDVVNPHTYYKVKK